MKTSRFIFLVMCSLLISNTILFSQVSLDWKKSYNPSSNHIQNANDIAAGDDGCYYVLGANGRGYNGTDVAIIKYNSAGELRWARSYDGGNETNSDIGKSIITRKEGTGISIYAACDISISGYGNQAGVMKYDSSGNLIWNKNIPVGFGATVSKITKDSAGFFFVGGGTSYEAFLIKLNSASDTLWVKKLPLPSGATNCEVRDIVTDNSGNVYCTGKFTNPVTHFDMFTCKYNSSGVLQWWKVYQYGFREDIGNALVISPAGNLYVTGRSDPSNWRGDIILIKYNAGNGDSVWVKRYNGTLNDFDEGKDITVDALDNIYITGQIDGTINSGDFATIKYNSSGTFQWLRKYSGLVSMEDAGKELALDSAGNIYVGGRINGGAGAQYIGIKYNSNGDSLWTRLFNTGTYEELTGMVLDKNYNFVVTGDCDNSDVATVKYNSAGQLQWMSKFYAAQLIGDYTNSLVADKNGNVYVAGKSRVTQYGDQFTVIKYNPSGAEVWIKSYGFQLYDNYDEAKAIVIDQGGFIYVTGTSFSRFNNQTKDYVTFKLDTAGNQYWYKTFHGSGNGNDDAKAICVDNSGNVYVTGESKGLSLTLDYCTIKYNSSGAELWVRYYNGTANGGDYAYDIAADNGGNVYVTGQSGGAGTGDDIATIKYNSSGTQQWVQRYNGSGNGFDIATNIELDKGSNVYVCGTANFVSNGNDAVLIKYGNDAAGTLRWVKNYNEDPDRIDGYFFMNLDTSRTKIYVSGQAVGLDDRYSELFAKYDSSGYRIWFYRGFFYGSSEAITAGMYLDEKENLYRTGLRTYPTGLKELLFQVTDSAGNNYLYVDEFYANQSGYGGFSPDFKNTIAVNQFGDAFIGYGSYDSTAGTLMSVIKYKQGLYTLDLTALIQGFYSSSSNAMIPDTVSAVIRNRISPYNKVDSTKSILNSSGGGTFNFANLHDEGNYYLVVKHRNSIETWTDSTVVFTTGILNYNFSTSADKAFGDNQIQVDASPLRFAIYNGDVNQDGIVDGTDGALVDNDASNFLTGYVVTDVNGDDIVDGSDAVITDNNAANFVSVIRP